MSDDKFEKLLALRQSYKDCTKCLLCNPVNRKRNNVVFGEGNINAPVVIIGEAPGAKEDEKGLPFIGQSGKLIRELIGQFGMEAGDLFITNMVLCRPTSPSNAKLNRAPSKEEIKACEERLHRTIEIIDPKVLILLGEIAYKSLTRNKRSMTKAARSMEMVRANIKGKFITVEKPAFVAFHPSYLLRNVDMTEGGAVHRTLLTIQKAISMADMMEEIYWESPAPDRGAPFEE